MTMHLLPERHRAIAFIFPAIIVLMAAVMFPIFIGAGLAWWPVFILAPAAIIAVIVCIEFRATAIGFDAQGVRYRAVGYSLEAPWSGLRYESNGGKPVLIVTSGQRHFHPWLGIMYQILSVLMPGRTDRASHAMASIPLYFFLTNENDRVMQDLRANAPEGFL